MGDMDTAALFDSVFLGGFECSCQRLEDGRRLDLIARTRHDVFAKKDYERLRELGINACRDGISWAYVEPLPGTFDFSTARAMIRAARDAGVRVAWDLMHFGWPDDVDPFSAAFPTRFARYAARVAKLLRDEGDDAPMVAPINEASYLAWAGGDVRCMNPFRKARGVELKAQLVRATIEAIDAIREVAPRARFLQPEPIIRIVPDERHPLTWRRVESDNELQFQAWDMLTGDVWPSLGGSPDCLDVIGVNFYPNNQFMLDGTTIEIGDERFTPLSEMLIDVWERYRRPMIVSETGSEGAMRAEWLAYVVDECVRAMEEGVELHGVTLYPIVNHPGWADGRHCTNGVWDYADANGAREAHEPLVAEIFRSAPRLLRARTAMLQRRVALVNEACSIGA